MLIKIIIALVLIVSFVVYKFYKFRKQNDYSKMFKKIFHDEISKTKSE